MKGKKILIAEDDADMRTFLRMVLASHDAVIIEAANGRDALKNIQGEKLDLVLLDIDMPAVDGIAVARHIQRLKETQKTPAVIFLTAKLASQFQSLALQMGIERFLTKPVDMDTLVKTVTQVLEASK